MAIDFTEISLVGSSATQQFCQTDQYMGGRSAKVAQFDLQSTKIIEF